MTFYIFIYSTMQIKVFRPMDHKVKALIYWASGSGKTVFGGTSPKPIFASAESGLLSISDKSVPFVEIKSLKDLQDLLNYLKNEKHDFETVVIDSISEINDIIKLEIEKKTGRGMQLQDWGDLSKKIKSIFRGFRDLPMHTLLIAQEMNDKDEDKIEKILPSLNGKSSTDIASFMDIVWYLYIEKTGQRKIVTATNPKLITKDRSNKIGNDTEVDFSVWVEKVKAIKLWDQKVILETKEDQTTPQNTDPVVEKTPETVANDPVVDNVPETPADDQATTKLPTNKVKQVQIKWKEFAEKSGWKLEDSDKKRKATMNKYFWVDSVNDLTVAQADEFVAKIDQAIEKIVY